MQRDDFTQELRLTSDYAGSLNFMLGAFYQDGELKYLNRLPANAAFADLGRGSLPPALYFYDNKVDSSTYSVFGQILWDITPDLELGVGTRWTSEDREHKITDLLPTLAGEPGAVVPFANPSIGDDNWSPEVSLTWTPSYDLTIYGNIKQAWKSGSFDVGAAWEEGDDLSFGDERVRGGELGLKSLWLDGSLAFNAAAYYYEYKDMQVTASQPFTEEGKIGVRTTNAASSDIYGIDSEISYSPDALEGLTLSGGLNWNHAEYDEFPNSNCYNAQLWDEGCNVDLNGDGIGDAQDLSNDELLRAPEWMADFTIQYQTAVFNDMTLMLGSNTSYSDDYSATSTNIPSGYQDSYVKTSATVSLSGPKDQWKVELIGDNLTDEIVYGNCNPAGYTNTLLLGGTPAFAGTGTVNGGLAGKAENACYADRGRSVWVRLTWNFI